MPPTTRSKKRAQSDVKDPSSTKVRKVEQLAPRVTRSKRRAAEVSDPDSSKRRKLSYQSQEPSVVSYTTQYVSAEHEHPDFATEHLVERNDCSSQHPTLESIEDLPTIMLTDTFRDRKELEEIISAADGKRDISPVAYPAYAVDACRAISDCAIEEQEPLEWSKGGVPCYKD